jgi:molybdate transport system substrate-binding protein
MTRALVGAVVLLVGCAATQPQDASLAVYAAASLRDAFEELAAAYTDEAEAAIVLSFDASSALRAQIEEGAPADVFASADVVNAQTLVDGGLTDGGAQVFAANALAIVVPADNPAGIASWADLAQPGLRIVAAGDNVPITRYAAELVANLAADPGAPVGFADAYAANVVSREDNVRSVLAKIEIGEGDAAIVYETDATASDDVTTIAVPDEANVEAEYAVVAMADASSHAQAFVRWLLGDAAQAILAQHGFRPPP